MSDKPNAMQQMAMSKELIDTKGRIETFKLVQRRAGAFHQAEKIQLITLADQYEILIQEKQSGNFKKLGYSKFTDFCEKEMDIGRSKVYEILKMSRDLGQEFFLAGTRIGLKRHTFLALAKHKEEIEIDTQGDVPKIIYLDEEIPADDIPRIQQLVKTFEEKDKVIIDLKAEVGSLKRDLKDFSDYQTKINDIKVQVISYGSQFKKLREAVGDDKEKYNALVREMNSLQVWIAELSDEILDQIQEDDDDDQPEVNPDDFNELSDSVN
jgi:hypothetical protein